MRVVVIGAGVIGLACAIALRRRGADVVILERAVPGAGASSGNAGWITPVFAAPLPEPGVIRTSLKWLIQRDGPLSITPRLDPMLLRWLWSFWQRSNRKDFERSTRAYASFAAHALDDFAALALDPPLTIGSTGTLFLFTSHEGLGHLRRQMELMSEFGYDGIDPLSRVEAHDLEPSISPGIVGAVLAPREQYLRPEAFVEALAASATGQGVELRSGTSVTALRRLRDGTVEAETQSGQVGADHVVVAAGAWSAELVANVGVRVPILPGHGYAVTISNPERTLRRPTYLAEDKVACTPFDSALRLAGLMELNGSDPTRPERRAAKIRRAADRYLTGWRGAAETHWVGPRPLTPDGLPVIGQVPGFPNLWLASGHGMLGVTLAPSTGLALAELICQGRSNYEIDAFDPGRFQ